MSAVGGYDVPMEQALDTPQRPFTRAEYERMAELGFFDNEKVELLYGRVVPVSPQGNPHALACERLNEILVLALAGRARVRPALPYPAADHSMPEPDLAVFPREYGDDHPTGPHLVIEVSASSLRQDTGLKRRLYAEAAVPEYWVVDLQHAVIRVHRHPRDGRWASVVEVDGGSLAPLAFPDAVVDVGALLG